MRAVSPPRGCLNTGRAAAVEYLGDLREQVRAPGAVDKTFAREAAREMRGCGVVVLHMQPVSVVLLHGSYCISKRRKCKGRRVFAQFPQMSILQKCPTSVRRWVSAKGGADVLDRATR
jgi:hypothetical protein